MLTGQAKTDYQRGYMCKRRSNERSNKNSDVVLKTVLPVLDPPEHEKAGQDLIDRFGCKDGDAIRARLMHMSISEIEAEQGFVPNWRREQG